MHCAHARLEEPRGFWEAVPCSGGSAGGRGWQGRDKATENTAALACFQSTSLQAKVWLDLGILNTAPPLAELLVPSLPLEQVTNAAKEH